MGVKLELSIKDGAAVEGRVLGDGAVTTGLCLLLGEASVVLREAWDGLAINGELVQVGGVTDAEGWVLRNEVAIVVGLVCVCTL